MVAKDSRSSSYQDSCAALVYGYLTSKQIQSVHTLTGSFTGGRHEEALQHARSAVFHGQERAGLGKPRRIGNGKEEMLAGSRRARLATLATLAISYHNLAVELEYTGRYDACLQW